jgi:hypothetical protein
VKLTQICINRCRRSSQCCRNERDEKEWEMKEYMNFPLSERKLKNMWMLTEIHWTICIYKYIYMHVYRKHSEMRLWRDWKRKNVHEMKKKRRISVGIMTLLRPFVSARDTRKCKLMIFPIKVTYTLALSC